MTDLIDRPGLQSHGVAPRPSYDRETLLRCARGELFGPGNAQLPAPPMLMMDRITEISGPGTGKHGKGFMRAELDIDPAQWFFLCHFFGDPVMPGCLGLDAMWQLVGFFLGWSGAPGMGRALGVGEVRFRGQVRPTVKTVTYKIDIKRVFLRRLTLGIADGVLEADGQPIYTAADLRVGLFSAESLQGVSIVGSGEGEPMRRVVVTGIGIVSSIGNNAEEVAASLREARSGVVAAPEYAELGFRCRVHAPPNLAWETLVDRRAARFLSEGLGWGHIALEQAIADAGLTQAEISHEKTGVIVGAGGPSTRTIVAAAATTREKGPKRVGPFAVPKAMCSGPSAVLATWFKIKGVNYSISSACATSTHCIGAAAEQIAMGKQDMVFAGGVEELDWTLSVLFDAMGAMSSDFNDTPSVASRAYDARRDGFVIAGGAGMLVVEELEHARARGAKIYAEIVGYAANSDGFDMVAPSGEGAARCMRLALEGFGGRPVGEPIDYLNPHGTGTPIGDAKEIEAVRTVFGERAPMISSTKSLTGHSLGAAGAQEAIYCLLMMRDGFAAKSAHIDELDPAFADMPILRERRDGVRLNTVMSNSFGFGGTNGCLVLQRFEG